MRTLILFLLCATLIFPACRGGEDDSDNVQQAESINDLLGSWQTQNQRKVTLTFKEEGQMEVSVPMRGSYEASYEYNSGEVNIIFPITAPMCAEIPGRYKVMVSEDKQEVSFTLVEDDCEKRVRIMKRTLTRADEKPDQSQPES